MIVVNVIAGEALNMFEATSDSDYYDYQKNQKTRNDTENQIKDHISQNNQKAYYL